MSLLGFVARRGHGRGISGRLRVETITGLPSSPHMAVKLCLGGVRGVSGLSVPAGWPGLVHPLRSLISTVLPVTATLHPPFITLRKNTWYCLVLCPAVPWEGGLHKKPRSCVLEECPALWVTGRVGCIWKFTRPLYGFHLPVTEGQAS